MDMNTPPLEQTTTVSSATKSPKSYKIIIKAILVFIIMLVLMIPILLIDNLVYERMDRQRSVINEISNKWGSEQVVGGPLIQVPYLQYFQDGKVTKSVIKYFFITPQQLDIQSDLDIEKKKRSIYEALLYQSNVSIKGHFDTKVTQTLKLNPEYIQWDKATLLLQLSDVRAVAKQPILSFNKVQKELTPITTDNKQIKNGYVASNIELGADGQFVFDIQLTIKGSEQLSFLPTAENSEISLRSTWSSPSFNGNMLPTWKTNADGFEANWNIVSANRTFPSAFFQEADINWKENVVGMKIMDTASHYTKTDRVIKYAFLIIALTFAVFFLVETMQKLNLHPIHYILVGLSLVVFYTLLLSFSEFIGFNMAYLIATIAIASLIGMYIKGVTRKNKTALIFTAIVSILYTYVYYLIQLEDMALIFGSVALFAVIALTMYFTKHINWYTIGKE